MEGDHAGLGQVVDLQHGKGSPPGTVFSPTPQAQDQSAVFSPSVLGKQLFCDAKTKFSEQYAIGELIGHGAFSVVHKVTDRHTGKEYALKVIDKARCIQMRADMNMIERLQTEVRILANTHHPNVVSMHDVFETDQKIFLVLELVTGGELFERIAAKTRYSEADASRIFRKLVEAVGHLHAAGIVHRDLKPENILLSSPDNDIEIKISDFGLSRIVGSSGIMMTCCGTTSYMGFFTTAPEVLNRQPYDKACDMWSLGVILYILLCGFPPFSGKPAQVFRQIQQGLYSFPNPHWSWVSGSAKELVAGLLRVNPAERLTVEGALAHPWVHGIQDQSIVPPPLPEEILMLFKEFKKQYRSRGRAFSLSDGGAEGLFDGEDDEDWDSYSDIEPQDMVFAFDEDVRMRTADASMNTATPETRTDSPMQQAAARESHMPPNGI